MARRYNPNEPVEMTAVLGPQVGRPRRQTPSRAPRCESANPRDDSVQCNLAAGHTSSHALVTDVSTRTWANVEEYRRQHFESGAAGDAHSMSFADMTPEQQHEIDSWNETFATPRKNRVVER